MMRQRVPQTLLVGLLGAVLVVGSIARPAIALKVRRPSVGMKRLGRYGSALGGSALSVLSLIKGAGAQSSGGDIPFILPTPESIPHTVTNHTYSPTIIPEVTKNAQVLDPKGFDIGAVWSQIVQLFNHAPNLDLHGPLAQLSAYLSSQLSSLPLPAIEAGILTGTASAITAYVISRKRGQATFSTSDFQK